jgi:hypothetical protein
MIYRALYFYPFSIFYPDIHPSSANSVRKFEIINNFYRTILFFASLLLIYSRTMQKIR